MSPATEIPVDRRFGMALAFAERTLTDALNAHLAKRDVKPETWYALQLVATRAPELGREALASELEASQNVHEAVPDLLARLEDEGLIRGTAEVVLAEEGAALHRSLREYIAGLTTELLGQFKREDVETTVRTLEALTDAVTFSRRQVTNE